MRRSRAGSAQAYEESGEIVAMNAKRETGWMRGFVGPRSRSWRKIAAYAALLTFLTTPTLAQSDSKEASSRYEYQKLAEGTLRLDRQSGEASLCEKRGPAWICQPLKSLQQARDREGSLLAEISRLATLNEEQTRQMVELNEKVQSLTGRLGALEMAVKKAKTGKKSGAQAMLPPLSSKEQPALGMDDKIQKPKGLPDMQQQGQNSGKKGSDKPEREAFEQFDEFFDFSEQMFRRFFGLVKELRRDFEDSRA